MCGPALNELTLVCGNSKVLPVHDRLAETVTFLLFDGYRAQVSAEDFCDFR
jgi:hypothetical protein